VAQARLLARAAPTLIASDRGAGARAIENGPHPATVIIMDDGLQNPALVKDLTIAVVDGGRGLGNGLVIPSGPLRAPLERQIEVTDIIIVNEVDGAANGRVANWLRHRFAGPVLRAATVPDGETSWLKGRVVAWAGIGAPQRFFGLLRHCGAEIIEDMTFGDHRLPTEPAAERLLKTTLERNAVLVTTEKDLARLSGEPGRLAELAAASKALSVKVQLQANDEERLMSLVQAALVARS
jgi:tetraacyldisaccharide 4'-kinase